MAVTMETSEITKIIKRLRAAGLSQTEIARRTGIPQPRISKWESGAVPVGADDGLRLAALVEQLQSAAVKAA